MMITDYELASVHLGKKTDRPLPGRATRLIRRDDHSIAVRYQSTDVVTYRDDLTAVLNTGGWLTSTTKERMKEYANARLFTDRGTWYIGGDWSTPKHLRPIYVDGMIVDARGVPLTLQYATPTDTERKRRLDKLVSTYIKGFSAYIIEHGIDNPSNGDCWGCLMQVQGKTETDHKGWYRHRETPHGRVEPMGMDHYISHFEEKYFVPLPPLERDSVEGVWIARVYLANDTGSKGWTIRRSYSPLVLQGSQTRVIVRTEVVTMPRNVRNFWLELSVDGKRSKVATGPIRKDGGFDLTILVRNRGSIDNALYVSGRADEHGNLEINVHPRMAAIDDQYTKGFTIPSQR